MCLSPAAASDLGGSAGWKAGGGAGGVAGGLHALPQGRLKDQERSVGASAAWTGRRQDEGSGSASTGPVPLPGRRDGSLGGTDTAGRLKHARRCSQGMVTVTGAMSSRTSCRELSCKALRRRGWRDTRGRGTSSIHPPRTGQGLCLHHGETSLPAPSEEPEPRGGQRGG